MRKINLALVAAVVGLGGWIVQVTQFASRGDPANVASDIEVGAKWLTGRGVVSLLLWHPKS